MQYEVAKETKRWSDFVEYIISEKNRMNLLVHFVICGHS